MAQPEYTKKSFGYYGGRRVKFISHPIGAKGYEQKLCCLCDGKALYRVGVRGYCKLHREDAAKCLRDWDGTHFAPRAAAFDEFETYRRRREQSNKRRRGFK